MPTPTKVESKISKEPQGIPITPGAWQGSHWSASFEVTGMTRFASFEVTDMTRP